MKPIVREQTQIDMGLAAAQPRPLGISYRNRFEEVCRLYMFSLGFIKWNLIVTCMCGMSRNHCTRWRKKKSSRCRFSPGETSTLKSLGASCPASKPEGTFQVFQYTKPNTSERWNRNTKRIFVASSQMPRARAKVSNRLSRPATLYIKRISAQRSRASNSVGKQPATFPSLARMRR